MSIRNKIILAALGLIFCLYVGLQWLFLPMQRQVNALSAQKEQAESLLADISPLLAESKKLSEEEDRLRKKADAIRNDTGGFTAESEEFLVFLGRSAAAHNVSVTGFRDLGLQNEEDIFRSMFDIELSGTSTALNQVLADMDSIGIRCSFGSVSYRQNEEYDYLKRFFDHTTELPWYHLSETEKPKASEPPAATEVPTIPEMVYPFYFPETFEDKTFTPPPLPTPPTSQSFAEPLPTAIPAEPEADSEALNPVTEQTSLNGGQSIVLLANAVQRERGQNMRLAMTVCLVMFQPPSSATSFLNGQTGENNGIF